MANKSFEAYVKCPFYLCESRNIISCEGFVKNTCMVTKFPDTPAKKEHMIANCFYENGGMCPMAKSLFAKYGMISVRG